MMHVFNTRACKTPHAGTKARLVWWNVVFRGAPQQPTLFGDFFAPPWLQVLIIRSLTTADMRSAALDKTQGHTSRFLSSLPRLHAVVLDTIILLLISMAIWPLLVDAP